MDSEKVIKGIDVCLQRFHCGEDCPYYELGCMEQLREDAISMLKEQEKLNQFVIQLTKKAVECCKINKCNDCPFKSFPSKCMSILMHTIESRRHRMEEKEGGLT